MSDVARSLDAVVADLRDRGIAIASNASGDVHLTTQLTTQLTGCTHDSREVQPGWLFCCVSGLKSDGHRFAQAAVDAGAAALLVERAVVTEPAVPQLLVASVRNTMGHVAASVHGHPSEQLTMIGVTGTNGKTSTAHMLVEVLMAAGYKAEVVGTLTQTRTTPESTDLHQRLAEFVRDGVTHVVMEVTSHALVLGRVAGMRFAVAVFTNLSQDHLDFHENMEAYFRAKAELFTPEYADRAVVNADDPRGRLLSNAASIPTEMFSFAQAENLETGTISTFTLRGVPVTLHVGGRFSVSNALGAAAVATQLGISDETIAEGLGRAVVPGRFEPVVAGQSFAVIVDYAHTPDGLIRVLESARSMTPLGRRLYCVFGCGGDRDKTKRPLMGTAAADLCDVVVVTADNPRSEEPQAIIADILTGIPERHRAEILVIGDRREAMASAINAATAGDVVVIAGKGHEQGQDVNGVISPFDDRVVARELIAARGAE